MFMDVQLFSTFPSSLVPSRVFFPFFIRALSPVCLSLALEAMFAASAHQHTSQVLDERCVKATGRLLEQ